MEQLQVLWSLVLKQFDYFEGKYQISQKAIHINYIAITVYSSR